MKTGFADPSKAKKVVPKDRQDKGTSPYNFNNPSYDNRDSWGVKAGSDYGTGINQPVGHTGVTKERVDALPFGRVKTLGLYGEV